MNSEVWVFAEQQSGVIKSVAYELLAQGAKLSSTLDAPLGAVCFGHGVEDIDQLLAHGADKVYLVDDPSLTAHDEDLYTSQLVNLIRQHQPQVVLAGATSLGSSFIPRVAATLETGLAANCTGLEIDPESGLLLQTRPTYGGNLMATVVCPSSRPQMATVRSRTFKKVRADHSRRGEVVRVDISSNRVTSRTKVLQVVEDLSEQVKMEEADIIVCGGRGLASAENFGLVAELAKTLGAALASSRPPVDDGWVPYAHQVGQTGKTVSPKVYVACGVSGAPQHLTGMQRSEIIVAINEDPKAPIFDIATYGIVGDLFKVVPMITARLKESGP